jgi:predicted RND superfamily exporter protein
VLRFPKTVVTVFAVIAVVATLGLFRLHEEENLLVFLPTDDPDVRLFSDVAHRFGGMRVALVGIEAPAGQDVFAPDALKRIQAATDKIKNVTGVDRLMAITTVPDVKAGAMGAEITPLVPAIPSTPEEQKALREKVLSREHLVGSIVSKDGRAALIMVFLAEGASDRQVTEALRAAADSTLKPLAIYYGGAPFAGRTIYEEAQQDVWRLSPIALAVLLLVVVFSFRDPVGVVLTVASVGFSVLVVLGGMGWFGEKFTVATSTLPVILFASGSSYAVHVLGRYYLIRKDNPGPESIRASLAIVGPPLLIAAGTTAVGFFSFVATDVRPMRAFGIACGSGVLLCWLTSLTLVPAVVMLWPRKPQPHRSVELIGEWLVKVWAFARERRLLVASLALVTAVVLFRPMLLVSVRMEPRAFFRVGSEPWLAERFLEEQFGGAHFVQVAVHGDLDDPSTLRELDRLEDFARSLPGVTQSNSPLGPLRLVNEVMGGGKRLPITRAQAANLYFFLEGEAGMTAMLEPGRKSALVHLRVRGDAHGSVAALEDYVANKLRAHPRWPTREDVGERIFWILEAAGQHPDRAQLSRSLRVIEAPGDDDREWRSKRAELARTYFSSEEAPPMSAENKTKLIQLVSDGAEFKTALAAAAPSPEEGGLAADGLASHLADARRDLAVARALPLVAGDHPEEALMKRLQPALDDLFAPAQPPSSEAFSAAVAGEPILDRGFSRSVERNQWRSLLISIAAVWLMLLGLFRSLRQATVCMIPSLLTTVILLGGMGAAGLPIDLGTSLVAGIATGAGSDFAMHYLWYLRRQKPDEVSRSVGPVMVVSILLVSLGFVVLALGRSPVMHLFGALAGMAMSLSAFLTCLLIPALLNKFDA